MRRTVHRWLTDGLLRVHRWVTSKRRTCMQKLLEFGVTRARVAHSFGRCRAPMLAWRHEDGRFGNAGLLGEHPTTTSPYRHRHGTERRTGGTAGGRVKSWEGGQRMMGHYRAQTRCPAGHAQARACRSARGKSAAYPDGEPVRSVSRQHACSSQNGTLAVCRAKEGGALTFTLCSKSGACMRAVLSHAGACLWVATAPDREKIAILTCGHSLCVCRGSPGGK